jgi:hypothetical protein
MFGTTIVATYPWATSNPIQNQGVELLAKALSLINTLPIAPTIWRAISENSKGISLSVIQIGIKIP